MVDKRFRAQLVQQLKFIENSCTAYDHGEQAEAIRIGTSLRMLLHDTPRSTSLLTHLEAKKTPLLSTCSQKTEIPDSTFFDELTAFTMNSSGIVIRPQLGDSGPSIELPAD